MGKDEVTEETVQLVTDEVNGPAGRSWQDEGRRPKTEDRRGRIRQKCRGQNDVVTKIAEYKIPSSGDANYVQ